jgi:hypothetical protein
MAGLPYEEQIRFHHATKPYSIDPFNELETPVEERDSLLISDFLRSYDELSHSISERVNGRYYQMGREFSS